MGFPLQFPPFISSLHRCITDALESIFGVADSRLSWSSQEVVVHLNLMEIREVFMALTSLEERITGQALILTTDNATVVAYVSRLWDSNLIPVPDDTEIMEWVSMHEVEIS